MPVASFVCPTYNGAGYLAETIESIRHQTVEDWELIVVDDGSTDTTKQLLEWYGEQDERILWVRHKENQGVCAARNAGNDLAKSPLILVIDHDDICEKNRLKWTLKHFEKHPDTDIFHGAWVECNIYGVPEEEYPPMKLTAKMIDMKTPIVFCHSGAAYPKKIAKKYPYRDLGDCTDDYQALKDWTSAGLTFRTTKRVLCGVRRLPMGQMQEIRATKNLPPSWRA